MNTIRANCNQVVFLDLSYTKITDKALRIISNEQVFSTLEKLHLNHVSHVTKEGIDYVLCRLADLENISI